MPATSTINATQIGINLPLENILLICFLILLAIYIVFTVVLHYHWVQYSSNRRMTASTLIVYGLTTVPVIIVLGILAITI